MSERQKYWRENFKSAACIQEALARAGQKHGQFEVPRALLGGVLRKQRTCLPEAANTVKVSFTRHNTTLDNLRSWQL
jgi:hypothetical protein